MKRKTLNKELKELSSYTEPLELPKHVALKFADIQENWTIDTPVAIICTVKDNNTDMEHILRDARQKTNVTETKFITIRKAAYAMEGPFLLILMIIGHPSIETLALRPA